MLRFAGMFGIFMIGLALVSVPANAQGKGKQAKSKEVHVQPKSEAAIYDGENGSKVLMTLSKPEAAFLIKKSKSRSFVRTTGGIRGWVNNNEVLEIVGSGQQFDLQNQEIVGWLDNPSAVYILDNAGPDLSALPLDRSFRDEIIEVKDREETERGNGEN